MSDSTRRRTQREINAGIFARSQALLAADSGEAPAFTIDPLLTGAGQVYLRRMRRAVLGGRADLPISTRVDGIFDTGDLAAAVAELRAEWPEMSLEMAVELATPEVDE